MLQGLCLANPGMNRLIFIRVSLLEGLTDEPISRRLISKAREQAAFFFDFSSRQSYRWLASLVSG